MDSIEGLKGKLLKVQQAFANPEVQYIVGVLNDLAKRVLTQNLTAKGEEAVRALGFQQGIDVINILPDILENEVKTMEAANSQKIKEQLRIK